MLSSSAHLPGTSSMGANGKKSPPHANGSSQQNGTLNGHNSNGSNSPNGTSSHAGSYQQQLLHNNYAYENQCLRCGQVVYQVDKIGPLKDFTFFHQGCFKCQACGTKLTLKTYYNNQNDQEDKEVYCQSHVPKTGPGKLDGLSVGIKAALRAPRTNHLVNEQIRGLPGAGVPVTNASSSPTSNGNGISKSNNTTGSRPPISLAGRFDASALHIQHGLNATKLQSQYRPPVEHAKIEEFLDEEIQRKLEMRHREEEDALYRQFARKRAEEESQISAQIREEWEEELQKLTSRLTSHNSSLTKERAHLEKNMTIKLDRRKETLTRKLLEQERAATAELVDKQSQEMIKLISEKLFEYQQASGVPAPNTLPSTAVTTTSSSSNVTISQTSYIEPVRATGNGLNETQKLRRPQNEPSAYPAVAPSPSPPALRKADLYEDPSVFEQIDEVAINVANQDQRTFTDLVRLLIAPCETDVQKARAIFRWITVKNLNTMEFDEHVNADTPMGILRGIKHGTESYHVLFKRLCAYAGLHCVVIKGYSKSAGYQPGVRFEDARFRNSWNAVYVAGGWRFVQCNWGARHLVNAKEIPRPGARGRSDSLRYEYDDHYFLTDPAQFVYEFYPLQHEWQLLRSAITLAEFEQLPFVRSLFFRYGLYFPSASGSSSGGGGCRAVLHTDSSGAATVRIGMPARLTPNLIFHYNLKYMGEREVGEESDEHEGTSLKRYVMQSVSGNVVSFRVHAPTAGQYIMDIFANATSPREYVTGEPMKFKSVCKFRLVASDLQTVMVPLPACASGEWGPLKASRLFGLVSLTHDEALIFATSATLEVAFRMSRPLSDFMASLHRNGYDEKRLSKLVSCTLDGEIVTFVLRFPEDGQYGLDIYTREPRVATAGDKQLLTHCCKYLINVALKN